MPRLARIRIYPVKALDPLELWEARISPGGGLLGDRRWAFQDEAGKFINGKNEPAVHRIRARFEPDASAVVVRAGDAAPRRFELDREGAALAEWAGGVIGRQVRLVRDDRTGFPDDLDAPGPTVVGASTLETVASWFPALDLEGARRRFRANLEIGGVEPFWEDRLYGRAGEVVRFRVGDVVLEGTNPCRRCVVPSRDPDTGAALAGFQKTFFEKRSEALPPWAEASRFDTYYRLSINTRIPASEVGKSLRTGEAVSVEG